MAPIILTGATGLIGQAVANELLSAGHRLIVFSRDPQAAARKVPGAADYVAWQPSEHGPWFAAIDGAQAVIHCAAPSIFEKRYTRAYAQQALHNRIISTRGLVNAIAAATRKPQVFISSASQGIYGFGRGGPSGDLDEDTPPGSDDWARESVPWEAEALQAEALGVRTVVMRTGYVLAASGGGLPYQVIQARKGQGGISQPADSHTAWIHLRDEARLYRFALEDQRVRGPLNATAPNPVTNAEYARVLGLVIGRPVRLMPYLMVRLFVGKVAEIYAGQRRVIPRKALSLGFEFQFPTLDQALRDLVPRIG